jgi:hypothetical protein
MVILRRVSLSISVRITIIRYVVYLLRIFKMFHGLMNNPVYYRFYKRKQDRQCSYNVTLKQVCVTIFAEEKQ